jgi:hypothetical protein
MLFIPQMVRHVSSAWPNTAYYQDLAQAVVNAENTLPPDAEL